MNNPQEMLKVTRASEIKPERQKWIYAPNGEGVIPLQTGTVFAGIGGEGKSSFAIHLAAKLSKGELEGDLMGIAAQTIIFGPEDDWATAMVPRLTAAGADLRKILKVTAESHTAYGAQERELKFPLDMGHLENVVIQNAVKLIIVDPISTSMTGDMNKVQDVRDALGALTAIAQKHELAVIAINHFKKGGASLADKMSGSHAMRDVVRSYLAFATDDETGERVITQDKNNYGTGFGSWKFVLESTQVNTEDGPTEVPAVRMLGASDVTVKDLIDREYSEIEEDSRKDWESWLIELLTEAGGSMEVKEIEKAANTIGFNFKRIQKDRPKIKSPKVETGRNGFGKGSKWIWRLEETSPIDSTENTIDSIDSIHSRAQESMESSESMRQQPESMTKASCYEHGTNYKIPTCSTCLELAKETA
jgi:hypothetical protein